ncbi:unnamed protein product, partial [Scytosiphon promiscuus]
SGGRGDFVPQRGGREREHGRRGLDIAGFGSDALGVGVVLIFRHIGSGRGCFRERECWRWRRRQQEVVHGGVGARSASGSRGSTGCGSGRRLGNRGHGSRHQTHDAEPKVGRHRQHGSSRQARAARACGASSSVHDISLTGGPWERHL